MCEVLSLQGAGMTAESVDVVRGVLDKLKGVGVE
jgi:hypothetical protein